MWVLVLVFLSHATTPPMEKEYRFRMDNAESCAFIAQRLMDGSRVDMQASCQYSAKSI